MDNYDDVVVKTYNLFITINFFILFNNNNFEDIGTSIMKTQIITHLLT